MSKMRRDDIEFVHSVAAFSFQITSAYMPAFHQHNDLELGFLDCDKPLPFTAGQQKLLLPVRRFFLFWSLVPHRNHAKAEKANIRGWSVNIPFSDFLGWRLSENLKREILQGKVVVDPETGNGPRDKENFMRWAADTDSSDPDARRSMLLEIEARLCRLSMALRKAEAASGRASPSNTSTDLDRFGIMVQHVTNNYRGPLQVTDIAAAAGIHPKYAMRLFRQICGITLLQYLTQHRVWHAQRLLASSTLTLDQIARESGFGSLSRFHDVFKRYCGASPGEYRISARG